LLKENAAGVHAVTIEAVKKEVLNYYNDYKKNGFVSYSGNDKEINLYDHRQMAYRYAILLNSICCLNGSGMIKG